MEIKPERIATTLRVFLLKAFMTGNIQLIQYFKDTDEILLRRYAVWLKMKGIHVNGRIYNYSDYKFSKQSGLSRTMVRKYIKFFIDNGWVREEGDSLVFISKEKLREKYGVKLYCNIAIDTESLSVQGIVDLLRYNIIKDRGRKQIFAKQLYKDQNDPSGDDALERFKKANKKAKVEFDGEVCELYAVSLYTLSSLIGMSISSTSRLIKPRCIKKVHRVEYLGYAPTNPEIEGIFWSKGKMFKPKMNEYIF